MSKLLCGIACLFLSAAAYADDQVLEKPLVAQTLAGFEQEATEIRAGMHQGGRYEFLKADDKSRVEARLNSMQALLQKHADQKDLNSNDKITLVNEQEECHTQAQRQQPSGLREPRADRVAPAGEDLPHVWRNRGAAPGGDEDALRPGQEPRQQGRRLTGRGREYPLHGGGVRGTMKPVAAQAASNRRSHR
jgi:hypothetical protein